MDALRIGALAERTGTNAPTIRYYEEIGLLRPPDRQRGGQRVYGEQDLKRLTFIRRCRQFGFPIEQVRSTPAAARVARLRCPALWGAADAAGWALGRQSTGYRSRCGPGTSNLR